MGFPKSKANTILSGVFKAGNEIALLTMVNVQNETYTEARGDGYARYTIKSGDFSVSDGEAKTARHILFGLAEGSWGGICGFAVLTSGGSLEYLGELTEPKSWDGSTEVVPVFKKYAEGEGIKVSLDVQDEAAAAVNDAS